MAKAAGQRAEQPIRREPDAALTRRADVASRYVLQLRDRGDPATVLRVLEELAIPLAYLLLLPAGHANHLAAYVGLGRHDVADLPIRFASQGLHLERGEELLEAPARCGVASPDALPRSKPSPRRPGPKPNATRTRRRSS
ncbi:MAG TPA: hypothetical protein VFM45_07645 [Anaeromyxobacteraceae bacterium]|nr:hypothetical protein [Anaeromyxobacteraceae bacterium]